MNVCQIETFPLSGPSHVISGVRRLNTMLGHIHVHSDSLWHLQNQEAYAPATPEAFMGTMQMQPSH